MVSRRSLLAATGVTGVAAATSPLWARPFIAHADEATPDTCELVLENSGGGNLNAYITGHEFGTDKWLLVKADSSKYYLQDTSTPQTPLPEDCSIPVGASTSVTLPRMYGARIYFVRDDKLEFFVNPGPALVEPAFATSADANFHKVWSFCEFTFNDQQLFANISYVDLVTGLPIGMTLEGDGSHTVDPLPGDALDKIASDLKAQASADGKPWDKLILTGDGGGLLRAVSPQGLGSDNFGDYWNSYVDQVWQKYAGEDLKVDIQGGGGVFTGRVSGDTLTFNDGYAFGKPNTADIFTCNSGPFANNPSDPDPKKGILARLAAAFNRSTLLDFPDQPGGPAPSDFYKGDITNHWARIVHAHSPIGYAFPYDDVVGDGDPDQSGAANDGNPRRWTVKAG
ncbi:MAG TPA: glycoside hydrolase family 64 protein [Stackebrandtia sp.]|uniref:glycoside hydrolase family 64 protein n=1 Tax=Stackebrandtia sp. TaxID=2023065 RepID=UPI002D5859D7|nr:glycoside hydrolase family 64 protein [Stackebrandtia sp.]HZE41583.1 glycoside hydrolase family 64 protein [Stackebrandtia sp.]